MIGSHELRQRDSYLNKLIGFQDTEPVKMITGIRRCGKSSLLKLMVQHLKFISTSAMHLLHRREKTALTTIPIFQKNHLE